MRPTSVLMALVLVVAALLLFAVPVNQTQNTIAAINHSPPQCQQAIMPAPGDSILSPQIVETKLIDLQISRNSISQEMSVGGVTTFSARQLMKGYRPYMRERNPLGPKLNCPLTNRRQLYITNS